ncbi:MAG TPA: caspase family protein [Segetibacter sp.]|jgi:WD40 repeat protein
MYSNLYKRKLPANSIFIFLLVFYLQPFTLLSQDEKETTARIVQLIKQAKQLQLGKSYDSAILIANTAVKLAETNVPYFNFEYAEALIVLGNGYEFIQKASPAHESYTKALNIARKYNNIYFEENAFISINQLHANIVKYDLPFNYKPATTTIEEHILFPIEKVAAKGDSLELTVNGGQLDGITDSSSYTLIMSRRVDSLSRNYEQIGNGRIVSVSPNRTVVMMASGDMKVLPGDLALITVQLPVHLTKSILQKYLLYALYVKDNKGQKIYDRRYMYYFFDDQTDSSVMKILKWTVSEIAGVFGRDTLTNKQWGQKISEGIFAGKNIMSAMDQSSYENLKYFLNYMSQYPKEYAGNDFKFSEIYATWALNNAHLMKDDVTKFLSGLKGKEREQQAHNLRKQILSENLNDEWLSEAFLATDREDMKTASQKSALLLDVGLGIPAPKILGWSYYVQGLCEAKNDNIIGADSLYQISEAKFREAGDTEGILWAKSARETLKKETSISFNVQSGHLLTYNVAMSPNPRFYATASDDNLVKIWDLLTNKEIKTFKAHTDAIVSIKYSPNGRYLVTSSRDSTIKIWNAYNYTLLQTIKTRKPESVAIFTPDSRKILSAGKDSLIKLWDPLTKTLIKTFRKHQGRVTDLVFDPIKPTVFLSSSYDSMVYQWDVDSVNSIGWFREASRILEVKVSANARFMSTVTIDSMIHVWNYPEYKYKFNDTIAVQRIASTRYYTSPDFSPDGNFIAYAIPGKRLEIVDLEKMRYRTYPYDQYSFLSGIHFSVDGNFMIQKYDLGYPMQIVNFSDWNVDKTGSLSSKAVKQYANPPIDIQFSKDDKSLVVLTSNISKYSLADGTTEFMYQGAHSFYHGHLLLDNENRSTYMGMDDLSVVFYDYKKKLVTDTFFLSGREKITALSVTQKDSIIYLGGANGAVEAQEIFSGRMLFSIRLNKKDTNNIKLIRVDTLHNRLYVKVDHKFYALHPLTGKLLDSLSVPDAFDVTATPKYIYASGADGWLYKYNADSYKLKKKVLINKLHQATLNLKMSFDYTMLAVVDNANLVTVINTTNDTVVYQLSAHDAYTTSITISHDNKFLATCGFDNKVNLYDLQTGKPVITLHTPLFEDFVASDPQGHYMASKRSLDGVVFNYKNNAFSFEQFDLQFNRPDIILSQLGRADTALIQSYYAAYKRRLKKLGLTEEQVNSDIHLPLVKILDKYNVRPTTIANSFDLKIECYDSKYKLQTLHVYVNNAPVFGTNGKDISTQNSSNVTENISVPLSSGNNLVKVYCVNEKGTASLKESFEILSNYKPTVLPKTYFIGIAVADYKDSSMNLTYSAKDVRDLASAFKKIDAGAQIDTLINVQATRENILALRQKLLQTSINDKVVVAVTGHGLLSDSLDFYYATYDVDFKDPVKRGLKYEDLENLLDEIPARQKLLLIDACHSGALDKESLLIQSPFVADSKVENVKAVGTRSSIRSKPSKVNLNNTFELMQTLFADLSANNGTVVISAAGGLEYAFESPEWNNGVFTYCVRKGLEEKLADKEGNFDGKVSVQELQQYVSRQVFSLTNGRQRPTSRKENFDYDWNIR